MPSPTSNTGCVSYFVQFLFRLLSGEDIPLTEQLFVLGAWNCPSVLVFSIATAIYWDKSIVYNHDTSSIDWVVAVAATLVALCGWHLCLYLFLDVCSIGQATIQVPVWSGRVYFVGHVILGIYAVVAMYLSNEQMKNFVAISWAGYWLMFSAVAGAYQHVLAKYARHLRKEKEQVQEETSQESNEVDARSEDGVVAEDESISVSGDDAV